MHDVGLDQLVGANYLVNVHGLLNAAVEPGAAMIETATATVTGRLDAGRVRPATSYALSYAVSTAVANRMQDSLATLTSEGWAPERLVTAAQVGDAELFLEEMFRNRHGLLALRCPSVRRRARAARGTGTAPPGRRPGLLLRSRLPGRGSAAAPCSSPHGELHALHARATARGGTWTVGGTG